MNQPMIVSLKGGASGAEALMYMKSSEGDPHKVLIAYSLIYMLPLAAKIPFNWRDLTPVSVIALDQFVLWDNVTLPYKNVKEFVAAAKSADPPVQDGRHRIEARGSRSHRVHGEKNRARKFAYLPYKSGWRGSHTARRQSHRRQRQQSFGESRGLARRAGSRVVRVRQGTDRLQDQGHRHHVVERYSHVQGRRARRANI
jgi:tripartite-type tricarboxylate transporter receptor subunit TctC